MKKTSSSLDLVEIFANAVIAQDKCIAKGDAKTGNRHAKQYIQAARQLLARGVESIDVFSRLLQHHNNSVRVTAAAYLLKDRTEEAVSVLRPIAEGTGLADLGAQMILERYRKGELEIK